MPQMKNCAWRALSAAALAFALTACQGGQTPPPQSDRTTASKPGKTAEPPKSARPLEPVRVGPIKVALLAPLSGDFADAGRDLANGAAMALFDTPETPAELIAYDTAGDLETTRAAIAKAAKARADIIVGPLFGRNAAAVAPDLETAKLTALTFSNNAGVAGPRTIVLGRTAAAETTRIVRHAASFGARTIAVFGKADDIGAAVADQAQREAAAAAGFQVRRALYPTDADYTNIARNVQSLINADGRDAARDASAKNLEAQLNASSDPGEALSGLAASRTGEEANLFSGLYIFYTQMMSAGAERPKAIQAVVSRYRAAGGLGGGGVDAVLLTMAGAELSTVAPMFQLYDAEAAGIRLLGLAGWAAMDPERARELHGGRFAVEPYNPAFDDKFATVFGTEPSDLAGVAFDAVKLALAASEATKVRPTPTSAFADAGEIAGAQGPLRVSATGIALRELEVLEMRPGGFFPMEPARIVDPAEPAVTSRPAAGS